MERSETRLKKMKKKGRIGSSFDDFLREEGIYEEVTASAIKRVIARQLGTPTSFADTSSP